MLTNVDLIIQIVKIEGSFVKSRGEYLDAHPSFSKDNDARITIFSRCINVFENALYNLLFRAFHLRNRSWWSSLQMQWTLNLPAGYQRMGIPQDIPIRIPSSEEIKGILDNVNNFWVQTNFISLFSVLETSARTIVRVSHPGNHGRGDIMRIYRDLLSTDFSRYECMLELFKLARNTSHNNGVYFPQTVGNDRHVIFNGVTYDFVDGQKVQYGDSAELLFFDIVPELLNMINDIVNSSKVSHHKHIIDPSV